MKNRDKKIIGRGDAILAVLLTLLAMGCIVFGILCLFGIDNTWLQKYFIVCASMLGGLIILFCALSIWLLLRGRKIFPKAALSGFMLLLFIFIVWFVLQRTGFFAVFRDADSLQEYLSRAGAWMPILYILLQFLQVVLLPIPSVVSTVAGVALFGAFWTMIYSLVGIILGSILAFYIGRKWGNRAVSWMIGKDSLKSWQRKLKGKDNIFLTIMFILPLFPDDVLCFLAGLSSMSTGYFFIMMSLSRIIAIASTCYSVNFIPFDTWWGLLIWAILITGIIIGAILAYKNMDKLQKRLKSLLKK